MVVWIAGEPSIPEIEDDVLEALNAKYTPLVAREGDIWLIDRPDLRTVAFTWDPLFIEPVIFKPIREILTTHRCGYIGFFKPSIAEVLAQIPSDLPPECNAFWTNTDVDCYANGSGHRAVTTFGII